MPMLAGHDEGGGNIVQKEYITSEILDEGSHRTMLHHGGSINRIHRIEKQVLFYGMSSQAANDKHFGGLKDYRAAEGREVMVPYKGGVESTIQEILGGVRSTCTYVGANKLKQLSKCTTFIRCTQQYNTVFT